ncbi:2480_t:CDS:2, partial [Paraglomus occultum]
TTMSYGAVPISSVEEEESSSRNNNSSRGGFASFLDSRALRKTILALVAIDFAAVMGTIIVTLLHPLEDEDTILAILNGEYWFLSLIDAIVVITTFTLDIVLTGNLREVASLLITFRFWRIVEVTEVAALGVARYDEDYDRQRDQRVKELEEQLHKTLKAVEQIANEDGWDDRRREKIFGDPRIAFVRSYYD